MRWMAMFGLFVAAGCLAQEPAQPQSSSVRQAQEPAAQKQTITVPAGTRVPVALTYSVWSKTAHAGDAVHAVTAFPVSVGTTVAIPAGTYVEGVVDEVWRRASGDHPALRMHFTRLLFANGYTIPLESATTEANAGKPSANLPAAVTRGESESNDPLPGSQSWMSNSFGAQQTPTLAPLPRLGPNPAVVAGVGTAALAGVLVTVFALGHHRGDYTMLDAGSQIDLVLQSPLNLNGDQVAAALASAH
jgi:hypothetical protein